MRYCNDFQNRGCPSSWNFEIEFLTANHFFADENRSDDLPLEL